MLENDAFPQCPRADFGLLDAQTPHRLVGHDGAAKDLPRPSRLDSPKLRPVLRSDRHQLSNRFSHLGSRYRTADKGTFPPARGAIEAGQLFERFRCRDHAPWRAFPLHAVGHIANLLPHEPPQRLDLCLRRWVRPEVRGADAGRPKRQRDRQFGKVITAECEFHRSAADIDVQQSAGLPAVPATNREIRQSRLLLTAEELQLNACLGEDLLEDLVAVTSIADRCGDERIKLVDPQLSSRSECPRNRGDNTIDALLGDRSLHPDLLGQPGGLLHRVNGQWWGTGTCVHHLELGGVRAHIQHAESHRGRVPA
jgi:hypothetical protein